MTALLLIIATIIVIIGALALPTKIEEPQTTLGETTTIQITPTATSTPTPTSSSPNVSIQNFQYPGSRIISQSETSLLLESGEDADAITDWYKEKIKAAGMNAKSFVVTKTNGNVLNKLVGSKGKTEIRVEITKSVSETSVRITVTIQGA